MISEISIIIPTYNEGLILKNTLQQLSALRHKANIEIIVADGGSEDETVIIAKEYATVVISEKGKAKQLNAGAAVATGKIYFFVHADMIVPFEALAVILKTVKENGFDGGGFDNFFDQQNYKIKKISQLIFLSFLHKRRNEEMKPVLYGDNGIFVKSSAFKEIGGFKEIPIMEDYDFSIRLNKKFRILKLYQPKLQVSSRRLLKNGIVKTVFTWLVVQKLYKAGVSPNLLFRIYRDVR